MMLLVYNDCRFKAEPRSGTEYSVVRATAVIAELDKRLRTRDSSIVDYEATDMFDGRKGELDKDSLSGARFLSLFFSLGLVGSPLLQASIVL